ncbi:MAG: MFS transporter [Actinobacteria bacterium]|nr:MFS transporter [Actinomycetota bacterium]
MRYAKPSGEMEWGKGFASKTAAKVALLLSGDDGMVQTALIAPLIMSIAMAYPDASEWLLGQLMAITATMMLPSILISSKLAQYFDKKKILMIGTVLFMCAGLAGMLAPTLGVLVFTRAVLGVGAGLAFPLVPSTISYLFREREKNQMLGWMNSTGALLSFTLSIAAGYIALVYWKNAFLFYLIFVPILFIQWKCLPNFKPEKLEAAEKAERAEQVEGTAAKEPLGWRVWTIGICMVCFMVIAMVATFKISLFIEGSGLGTSASSGMGISAMTCASLFISLVFERYLRVLKRYAPIVSLLFLGVAFLLLSVAQHFLVAVAAMAVLGLCMGTMNPYLFSAMSRFAPATRLTLGMSLMCLFQLAGQIFTPYYMMAVSALGFATERQLFMFTAVFVMVAMVVLLAIMVVKKPDYPGEEHHAA